MDKKIGKILFLITFFSNALFSQDATVRLYIKDMEDNLIRQAEKGVPFLLQVVVDNVDNPIHPENILGLQDFQVQEAQDQKTITIINGNKNHRTIYNYIIKGNKSGSFKIGPVEIKDNKGTFIQSEPLRFHIGDKVVGHSIKRYPYFLQVDIDKKSLYIGEELLVKIRFYYIDEFENLRVVKPEMEDFVVGHITKDPISSTESIQGKEYRYQEWQMRLYPEKTGTLLIPPYQAVFMMPANFSQGLLGVFDMFSMSSERIVQSSARSVDVLPLPESKTFKNVTAVGAFDKALFSLNKNSGDIGEGIVAKLIITGAGNVEACKAPALKLPSGLKYYESNSTVRELIDGMYEKSFEYILQAESGDDFIIPQQSFVYYDVQDRSYKELFTEGAFLKISSISSSVNKNKAVALESALTTMNQKYQFKDNQINFVHETGLSDFDYEGRGSQFVGWLLMILGWLTVIAILYWGYSLYIGIHIMDMYWIYYLVVRVKAIHICKRKDVYGLYHLVYDISKRYEFDLLGSDMVKLFEKTGKSKSDVERWHLFLSCLQQLVFSSNKKDMQEVEYVVSHGAYWVRELLYVGRICKQGESVLTL